MSRTVAFALLPLVVGAQFPPLNVSTLRRIQRDVQLHFALPVSGSYGEYCNPCIHGDNIGALVRLPFHDAMGGGRPDGKGGPNGCIDWTTADNNGLQAVVATLNAAWNESWSTTLSKADFWVVAAHTAIVTATTLAGGAPPAGGLPVPSGPLVLPFRYGRVDDASCDGVDAAFLPSPLNTYAQTSAAFVTRVGMTPRQLVAVMGAHTLGRAEARNSGFDGSWSGFGSSFSVAYYTQLIGSQWSSKDAPTGGWLTSAPPPGPPGDPQLVMMKGPDVELMISPSDACPSFQELNFTTPTPTPPPGQRCPVNAINQAALTDFARNQTLWWSVFTEAWTIMTEFTYSDLKEPVPG